MERFWSKVARGANEECWPWKASRHKTGYGKFGRGGKRAGWVEAHRAAYQLTYGEIPDGLQVCHRCDNKPCCNPAHLFLGTAVDNINDKVAKGRHRWKSHSGSENGNAGFTEAQVREIRLAYQAGMKRSDLAKKYGVSWTAINYIVSGITWTHLLTEVERDALGDA